MLLSSSLCCLDEHPSCGGEEGEGLGEDELLLEREGRKVREREGERKIEGG